MKTCDVTTIQKITSLCYYNLARSFKISPTFLIYFEWDLTCIQHSGSHLVKKECFFNILKEINTAFNEAL
jgi:hypothetical protein